jgi:opacity protein-like surface antigen
LRYSLDPTHALGLSFEDLRFGRKSGSAAETARQYQVVNYMLDYYVYFNRARKWCPYLAAGAGLHRDTFRVSGAENIIPPERFVANLGAGLEYFVTKEFTADLLLRGYYLQGNGGNGLAGSAMLGFQFYLLR